MPDFPDAQIAKTALFQGRSERERSLLGSKLQLVKFARGQIIYSRGEAGEALFLLAQGQVRLSVATSDGRELTVRIARSGDILGEIAVLDRLPRSAGAVALTAVTAYSCSRFDFDSILAISPKLSRNVIDFLCGRLRNTTEQLESVGLYSIEVRLARYLLILSQDQNGSEARRSIVNLDISQSELAQLLGASRPKLNVALGALEQVGALTRKSGKLLCNREALSRIAVITDD